MKTGIAIAAIGMLAGCVTTAVNQPTPPETSGAKVEQRSPPPVHAVGAMSLERYKRVLAQHIASRNPDKIYPGNPQAMLRSVVVLKYTIDGAGKLLHGDIVRANGDPATIATALGALRQASPFPQPPGNLLSHGQLEILETMLFNDDGRFQLRSIASPQLEE